MAIFVLVLPLAAQSPEPSDESAGPLVDSEAHSAALALYDANRDGAIDVDELLTAVRDHLDGRIDKDTGRKVMELHLGGTMASIASGAVGVDADKDWARIACHWLGCGPLTPTPTPTDTPVAGPPYSPTPTPTHTPTPTDTPTPVPPLPPSPSPWTPSPTPIPRLSDPCGHYDFNGNGKIDKNEVDQAVSDEANGTLHRKDALAVVACYFAAPKPKPPPDPTATHTPTPTPGDTPTPVPGNPSPTPAPTYTPIVPITNPEFNVSIYRRTGVNPPAWTKFKPADWKVLHRAVMRVSVTPKVAGTDVDVTIGGYQYTGPSSGRCGNGLGCVKRAIDPSIAPHMGSQKM